MDERNAKPVVDDKINEIRSIVSTDKPPQNRTGPNDTLPNVKTRKLQHESELEDTFKAGTKKKRKRRRRPNVQKTADTSENDTSQDTSHKVTIDEQEVDDQHLKIQQLFALVDELKSDNDYLKDLVSKWSANASEHEQFIVDNFNKPTCNGTEGDNPKTRMEPNQENETIPENKQTVDGISRTFSILRMGTASMLRIPVICEQRPLIAVIDTAAEVTIISDKLYNALKEKPSVLRKTIMHAAGRGMQMDTFIVGPVNVTIGSDQYPIELYVAPIEDDMLLGLDFLSKHKTKIDINRQLFTIGQNNIAMYQGPEKDIPVVATVTLPRRTVIPSHSVVQVNGKLDADLDNYIVESTPSSEVPWMIPRCLYQKHQTPRLCIVNPTDRPYTIKRNTVVAQATLADPIQRSTDNDQDVMVKEVVISEEPKVPEKLQKLVSDAKDTLTEEQASQVQSLLLEYQDIFSNDEFDIGVCQQVEHAIDTGTAKPIQQRLRRTPIGFANEEEAHLKKMLQAGVVEPSISEWASPPVLIRKRDGKVRYAIDYRKLNSVTKKEIYPLPLIEECIDTLAENEWYSKLDANSAYWQVKLKEEDKPKTAFITKYGLFQFTRMAFGLCNAPATYARAMQLVLRGLTWDIVLAFLDDILVMGRDFPSHVTNLKLVFDRFREYGIKLKAQKCELCTKETTFLGRKVNKDGLSIGDEYIKTIENWEPPRNAKQVEQFLGFTNYHRTFIKDFSKMAAPLTEITGKKMWKWKEEQQQSFEMLKQALQTTPVLALPNKDDQFILDTDASDKAIGAELLQVQNGQERVIAYGSFTLSTAQRKYCTTRKELLAVVRFTQHFRHYLLGREFILRTDHNSLRWLMNFKEPQGQLARWLEVLSQYHMTIKHRSGNKHTNADVLSRYQPETACKEMSIHVEPEKLPCKGCTHCTRVHRSWTTFANNIDDTIALGQTVTANQIVTREVDNSMRSLQIQHCEKIQREIDTLKHKEKTINELNSQVKNKALCKQTRKRQQENLYNLLETTMKILTSLVEQLHHIQVPEMDECLTSFKKQTENEIRTYFKFCEKVFNTMESVKIRQQFGSKKKHFREGKCKQTLDTIEELDETIVDVFQPMPRKRFDKSRQPHYDPEALTQMFEGQALRESQHEVCADSSDKKVIEMLREKEVKVVSTRQKKRQEMEAEQKEDNSTRQRKDNEESHTQGKQNLEEKSDLQKSANRPVPLSLPTQSSQNTDTVISEYTTEQLRKAQEEDTDLSLILYYLTNDKIPPQDMIVSSSPAAKKYWVNKEFYYLNDDKVLWNKSKNNIHRLVVPRQYVEEVTSLNHDLICTGHQGIQRTKERIKPKYYWYRMNEYIKYFVMSCNKCNKFKKASRKARAPLTKYHAGSPMERVHIDFLGPLPETPRGNTNILVMVDQFTKWCEIIPLPSQTAEVTAKAAVNDFFTRFGCPFILHSDQGRNFERKLFKSICDLFKVHKTRTTPYRPSANGQVERYNRTLMDAVRCFVAESQEDWDEYLPQLACAIRSSVNRNIGMTPNKMMLGREINLPADLIFKPSREEKYEDEEEYVAKLRTKLRTAHEIARETLQTTQETMKRDYDIKMNLHEYKCGDLVYVLDTANIKGRAKKLDPPWKGPGIIADKLTSYVYKIKLENKILVINHDRIKKCRDRTIPTWLREVKNRFDSGENILEVQVGELLCLCRQPDDGGFMIQCDGCDEWFHGKCVQMTPELADAYLTYYCPKCQTPTLYPDRD